MQVEQQDVVSEEVRRRNARVGILLGLLAATFFVGFMAKFALTR